MQQRYLIFFFSLVSLLFGGITEKVFAQTTIEVSEPGTLKTLLAAESDHSQLIITGQLNATDFDALRQSNDIESLNLSEVEIVAGGSYIGNEYLDTQVETTPGVMPGFFLFQSKLKESLTSIVLPSSVHSLGERCLQDGAKLTEITLPEELTELGELSIAFCSALESIELPETLIKIGGAAFEGCSSLTEVSLPETLTQIGASAFYNCSALQEIEIPEGVTAILFETFKACTSLESLKLPHFIKTIDNYAFEGCTALTEITIPYRTEKIGNYAFNGCEALEQISFQTTCLKAIGDQAFNGCKALESIDLPASVEIIGGLAFMDCEALKKIKMPARLKKIMGGSFSGTAIEEIILPNGCEEIGYAAFARCANLTHVTLPGKLRKLGEVAFGKCEALNSVYIPTSTPPTETVQDDLLGLVDLASHKGIKLYVPNNAREAYATAKLWKDFPAIEEGKTFTAQLSENSRLASLVMDAGNPEIYTKVVITGTLESEEELGALKSFINMTELDLSGVVAAEGHPIPNISLYMDAKAYNLRKLILPSTLKESAYPICQNLSNLEEVVLPEGLSMLGEAFFSGCGALKNISLPKSLTSIGGNIFEGCVSLSSITLPEGVQLLPSYAFFNCTNLTEVKIPEHVAEIGEYAFAFCISLPALRLPKQLNEIKDGAFLGCEALKRLEVLNPDPIFAEEGAFVPYHFEQTTIVVPTEEIKTAYQAADVWQNFKNYLVDASITSIHPIDSDTQHVYGSQGAVLIELAELPKVVRIYDNLGNLLHETMVAVGSYRQPLAPGLYIVTISSHSYKIYVY